MITAFTTDTGFSTSVLNGAIKKVACWLKSFEFIPLTANVKSFDCKERGNCCGGRSSCEILATSSLEELFEEICDTSSFKGVSDLTS